MENTEQQIPSAKDFLLSKGWTGHASHTIFPDVMEEYASLKVEEERKKHEEIIKNQDYILINRLNEVQISRDQVDTFRNALAKCQERGEEQQSRIEELTKALEWKDRIISDLKEKLKDNSPF